MGRILYWASKNTHQKFNELVHAVADITIRTKKDEVLFEAISEELRDAASARNLQLVLSQTKISNTQWVLNIFLSVILIIGLIFLSIQNYLLSIFIVASMIASVLMILLVIYQLDSLSVSYEEVSVAPYKKVMTLINEDKF